jgi:hypothetical protein
VASEVLTASLKQQALQIQKVSAQLEVSKIAPQMVLNKQEWQLAHPSPSVHSFP